MYKIQYFIDLSLISLVYCLYKYANHTFFSHLFLGRSLQQDFNCLHPMDQDQLMAMWQRDSSFMLVFDIELNERSMI